MKLELMNHFFDSRLEEYENHMLECIESAREFYKYTASILPMNKDAAILDLGCGTGLELDEYFTLNPSAHVTGIDLAQGMLSVLKAKHSNKNITLICGSYFDEDFGTDRFDAAVSVESLHHFTASEKRPLYTNLFNSLKSDSYFVLTDYFASGDHEEKLYRSEYIRLKKEQGLSDDMFYHYDTPLTVDHEIQVLLESGFNRVEILQSWSNTYTLKAIKS